MSGKRTVHVLDTADRRTADGEFAEWLGNLKNVDPGDRDNFLAKLFEKIVAEIRQPIWKVEKGEHGGSARPASMTARILPNTWDARASARPRRSA